MPELAIFDVRQVTRVLRAAAVLGHVYTQALWLSPEMIARYHLSILPKRALDAWKRSAGRFISVYRADIGVRWENDGEPSTGSEWSFIVWDEPESEPEAPDQRIVNSEG